MTRQQFGELAVSLAGKPANPAPVQSALSYNFLSTAHKVGAKYKYVVQPRGRHYLRDIDLFILDNLSSSTLLSLRIVLRRSQEG